MLFADYNQFQMIKVKLNPVEKKALKKRIACSIAFNQVSFGFVDDV